MSNSICLYCGHNAEGSNFQEIFDEVGIELQLNKLLEEHFQINVEKNINEKQILCEDCVNKLIDLYDLAEHAKQQQQTSCISNGIVNTKKENEVVFVQNRNEKNEIEHQHEHGHDEIVNENEIVELEENGNCFEIIVENGQRNSLQTKQNVLVVQHYDREESEENESQEDEVIVSEDVVDSDCGVIGEGEFEGEQQHEEVRIEDSDNGTNEFQIQTEGELEIGSEEFITTSVENEIIIEGNEATNVVVQNIPVESLDENENIPEEEHLIEASERESTVVSEETQSQKGSDESSDDDQGAELELCIDEIESCTIFEDMIPDGELQPSQFDFIDVDSYLEAVIKSNLHELQFNWLATCQICDLAFETFQDFYSHIIMVHYDKVHGYTCTIKDCSELVSDFKKLARHIIIKHCDLRSLQIYGSCRECDMRFSNFLNYNKHSCCNTLKRRMGIHLLCKKCDVEFPSWKRYIFHLQFHMPKQRPKICFLCFEYFDDINDFFVHVHYAHEDLLACKQCDRIFEEENLLAVHMQKHNSKKKFKCPHCVRKYDFRNLLLRHIEVTHSQTSTVFQCITCSKTFLTKLLLNQHVRTHRENQEAEIFYCTMCGLLSEDKNEIEEHINEEDSPCFESVLADDYQGQSYVCEFCNRDFKTPADVKAHRQSSLHADGLYSCRVCNNVFHKYFSSQNHIKTHKCWEEWLEAFPLTRYYVCDAKDCMETYNNWPALYSHKKRTHKYLTCNVCQKDFIRIDFENHKSKCQLEWEFKCQFCGKECPTKMSLSVHIARVHNNNNVTCPQCKGSYKSKEKLKEHIAHMHTQVKCEHCAKIIKNQRNYESHLKNVHLKQHRHTCQFCGKTFLYKSEKETHEKNVHSETTFTCTECPFETSYKKSMHIHIATTHKMEYEFKCHLCGRDFGRKQTLINHLKRHKSSKEIPCPQVGCNSFFLSELMLAKHMDDAHGIKNNNRSTKRKRKVSVMTSTMRKSARMRKDVENNDSSNSTTNLQDIEIEELLQESNVSSSNEDYMNSVEMMSPLNVINENEDQDENEHEDVDVDEEKKTDEMEDEEETDGTYFMENITDVADNENEINKVVRQGVVVNEENDDGEGVVNGMETVQLSNEEQNLFIKFLKENENDADADAADNDNDEQSVFVEYLYDS